MKIEGSRTHEGRPQMFIKRGRGGGNREGRGGEKIYGRENSQPSEPAFYLSQTSDKRKREREGETKKVKGTGGRYKERERKSKKDTGKERDLEGSKLRKSY